MFFRTRTLACIIVAVTLTACNLPSGSSEDSSLLETTVAQTVEASLPTGTTSAGATQGVTVEASPGGEQDQGVDDVKFISDVTIPDNTSVEIGAEFVKTWRLQNTGESTWTTGYQVVFSGGVQMGAADGTPLPRTVNPGEFIDVSVTMTAPDSEGEYRGDWLLADEDGITFGLGEDDEPFWVLINVVEKLQTGTGSGITGGADISTVKLSADATSFSGSCPAVIVFTWKITTSNDGLVQYTLNFTPQTSGYTFDTVPVNTENVSGATTLTRTYTFITTDSVSATAQAVATGSSTVISAPLGFNINCN